MGTVNQNIVWLNLFALNGFFHLRSWTDPVGIQRGVKDTAFFCVLCSLMVNSVDPDQTPRSAASDLGLHYLPKSIK